MVGADGVVVAVDVAGGGAPVLLTGTGRGGGKREGAAEVGGAKGPGWWVEGKEGAALTGGAVVEGTETGGGRDMPPHAGVLTLADTTGDLELKLRRPPALGVDVVATLVGALGPGTHTAGGGPNGDEGAGHVAGVVELPLLKLLTLLLQHNNNTY